MRTVTKKEARDTVAPTLQKGKETLTDTVLPTVRDAFGTARDKGVDFLDSDIVAEARRRGLAVVKAAKGQPIAVPKSRKWTKRAGFVAGFGGLVFLGRWVMRKMATPVESYTHTMPVGGEGGTAAGNPLAGVTTTTTGAVSGTGIPTSVDTGSTPATGSNDQIDLRAGSPTL